MSYKARLTLFRAFMGWSMKVITSDMQLEPEEPQTDATCLKLALSTSYVMLNPFSSLTWLWVKVELGEHLLQAGYNLELCAYNPCTGAKIQITRSPLTVCSDNPIRSGTSEGSIINCCGAMNQPCKRKSLEEIMKGEYPQLKEQADGDSVPLWPSVSTCLSGMLTVPGSVLDVPQSLWRLTIQRALSAALSFSLPLFLPLNPTSVSANVSFCSNFHYLPLPWFPLTSLPSPFMCSFSFLVFFHFSFLFLLTS